MHHTLLARQLWAQLWDRYRQRVPYAQIYQQMIESAGGAIANDHIAFRSLRLTLERPTGCINLGIPYLADWMEALGYHVAGEYEFPDQHLYARHYRHPDQDRYNLPKLFISELLVDELPQAIAQMIGQTVQSGQFCEVPALQHQLATNATATDIPEVIGQLEAIFTRPWQPPRRAIVDAVNAVSQYGAWVLLHGYAVNHFTGYINRQHTPIYLNIEHTAAALASQGVPMKSVIEGSRETGLRQTATQAVVEPVTVLDDTNGQPIPIPWTYAYYELAERHPIYVAPGQTALFEGFLSAQAKHLFEMTRTG